MAIYLCTGIIGSGKTLNTLKMVYDRAKDEDRVVWYYGIELIRDNGVGIDYSNWVEMQGIEHAGEPGAVTPHSWQNAPDGAIIVIDECHKYYPPVGVGAKLPDYIVDFSESRHRGFDIYLITQGPARINSALKDWVQPHIHFRRLWHGQTVWRYDNEQCINDIRNTRAIAEAAIKSKCKLDKRWFKAYVSASQHSKNRRIPVKLLLVMLLPFVLLPGGLWYLYDYYQTQSALVAAKTSPTASASPVSPGSLASPTAAPVAGFAAPSSAVADADRFDPNVAYAPRIEGMPETAPAYDELRRPQDFPRPSCLRRKKRCECYSQQGTLMRDYPRELCLANVKHGYFDPTRPRASAVADGGLKAAKTQK